MKLDIYSSEQMQMVERILTKVYRNTEWDWDDYSSRVLFRFDDYDYEILTKIMGGED